MSVSLAHKIQIKNPTEAQVSYFKQACGTARFAYNWGLGEWQRQYKAGLKPTAYSVKKAFNAAKKEAFPWTGEVTKCAPEQAFNDLGRAYQNFFKRRAQYPKPKKRKHGLGSFYISNDQFSVDGNRIRLPKLGQVRLTESLRFDGKILGARISESAGRWFVSIQVELPESPHCQSESQAIVGVDLGISRLATLSTGEYVEGPRPFRRLKRRLKRLQRGLRLKPKGSRKREKLKQRIARLHYRISCQRQDALHKLTTRLNKDHGAVFIEDLNIKGMMCNERLSLHIADMGLGEFRRQLQYKSQWRAVYVGVVDRFMPTSKACSGCGAIKDDLTLADRIFICGECGLVIDRDLNAAKNIHTAGFAGIYARGHDGNAGLDCGDVPATSMVEAGIETMRIDAHVL
jgi:transposase, IS605 OrfB family, central region